MTGYVENSFCSQGGGGGSPGSQGSQGSSGRGRDSLAPILIDRTAEKHDKRSW